MKEEIGGGEGFWTDTLHLVFEENRMEQDEEEQEGFIENYQLVKPECPETGNTEKE